MPVIKKLGSVLAKPLFSELLQNMYYKISYFFTEYMLGAYCLKEAGLGMQRQRGDGRDKSVMELLSGSSQSDEGGNLLVVAKILNVKFCRVVFTQFELHK